MKKTIAFFGHRNTKLNEEQIKALKDLIENLIINKEAKIFLFGSRSCFDYICHKIVTDLKEIYTDIQRKCYTCKHETCILEKDIEYWEGVYSSIYKRKVDLIGVEEEVEYKTKWTAGRASYIERNQAMINDSDYCIFYYDENYQPEMRKYSKRSICYQPKSGTALAYAYAKQKKKIIYNIKY